MIGCRDWEPNKCIRCGAYLGMSSCFKPFKGTKEEIELYYKCKKDNIKIL